MKSVSLLLCSISLAAACGGLAAQERPEVTQLDPPHLTSDVPANTSRLVVHFDQDMDPKAYAVCGGGVGFPKVKATDWIDARTFVLEVALEADRVYSMDLSCIASSRFRAKSGLALAPTPWRIATKGTEVAETVRDAIATRLLAALRDQYSYRDRLGIDWNDFERRSYTAIVGEQHMSAIALRIAEVLGTPQDPHISVGWRGATLPTFLRATRANFHARALSRSFPRLARVGQIGLRARTDDDVGYLLVGTFARQQEQEFDLCLDALKEMRDCKALVLDLRTNGGGDETLARKLAAWFVEGEKVYAQHRFRDPDSEDGFGPVQKRVIRGNRELRRFTGPVAVLMGPMNMSSCEAFLLMMKQAPRATLIGETSYGSSGNPKTFSLAPELTVQLPSWQALRPDGSCFEGEGIDPTIPIATPEAVLGKSDPVLEESLVLLRAGR